MKGIGASSSWVSSPRKKQKLNRRVHLRLKTQALAKLHAHEQRQEAYRARKAE